MDLRGIALPTPYFRTGPLAEALFHVEGYRNLQTYFPTLTKLFRLGKWNAGEEIWMDCAWRVQAIDCSGTAGPCQVSLVANKTGAEHEVARRQAYLKVTHLLDPIRWMRGQYALPKEGGLPWHRKGWQRAWQKLQDPGNQAYVDAIASYALGRLREEGLSPHFNLFYGAFCARAGTYRYNLSEDFPSYRHERWFWRGHQKGLFALRVLDSAGDAQEFPAEVLAEFMEAADSESGSASEEELEEMDVGGGAGSIASADSMSDVSFAEAPESDAEGSSGTEETDETEDSEGTVAIYAQMENFPVMLILAERNTGTMDDLFEDHDAAGAKPGTEAWEARWAAWLFQIVAALSCAQTVIGFTHNDLHTNNIVWSATEEEWFYYSTRSGSVFRVPTYGKVFRIIDFGRAIFTVNRQMFISDDFKAGNDAEGQYAFPPLVPRPAVEVRPNPSFDLCRLAVSLIDGVFPKVPREKKGGAVLSDEPGLRVTETVSTLYNMVWSWMVDDEGRNIFINPDGSERFPDFDLYKHIAAAVHRAIPAQQIHSAAFDGFQVERTAVPEGKKVYSLFC